MTKLTEYETICVFAPDMSAEQKTDVDGKIQKIFSVHKVEEVTRKDWGNRKLAYPIKNFKTANYVQLLYSAPNGLIPELEKNLGYEEVVLRFLTLKVGKDGGNGVEIETSGFEVSDY